MTAIVYIQRTARNRGLGDACLGHRSILDRSPQILDEE
jgi:hypothetical protein